MLQRSTRGGYRRAPLRAVLGGIQVGVRRTGGEAVRAPRRPAEDGTRARGARLPQDEPTEGTSVGRASIPHVVLTDLRHPPREIEGLAGLEGLGEIRAVEH